MNYIKLILLAFTLTLVAIIRETLYPFMVETSYPYVSSQPTPRDHIYIYTIRFIHLCIFIYTSYYLFFGIGNDFDMYLYMLVSIIVVILWYIYECCPVTYIELLFYNIDLENVHTNFNAAFCPLFNDYTSKVMMSSGILFLITNAIVTYKCKLPILAKILFYISLVILFFDSIYKGIINTQYYSTKNKQLLVIYNFYKKYLKYVMKTPKNKNRKRRTNKRKTRKCGKCPRCGAGKELQELIDGKCHCNQCGFVH